MHVSNMQIDKIVECVQALNSPSDGNAAQVDRTLSLDDPCVGKSFLSERFARHIAPCGGPELANFLVEF